MENDLNQYLTLSRTKPRLLQGLYTIALVRYSTPELLRTVKKPYSQHIYTKKSLIQLSELGFIDLEPVRLTSKGFKLLENNGFYIEHLQKRMRGIGNEHDLKITKIIFSLQPFTVFYPYFDIGLQPDACLIFKNDKGYKIEFLEVENSAKPEGYLEGKKMNYERLAQDFSTWNVWWREWSAKLDLPFCTVDKFCFCIVCYGKSNYTWSGWRWMN